MRITMKRIFAIMLVVVMTIGAAPLSGFVGLDLPEFGVFKKIADSVSAFFDGFVTKAEAATSGTCGKNLTWTFDDSIGEFVISGTGEMYNYRYGNTLWENCEDGIKIITIGNGVTSIGGYAFYNCDSLTNVTIPDSVTIIDDCAFGLCNSLASITIPDSVTNIGDAAFAGCTSLTSVTIPNSVTNIGKSAFGYCRSLTSITIGNGVTSIGDYALESCQCLTSITVDSENPMFSSDEYGVLFNKDKTELIQYPIGNARTSYVIPDSVTSIGKWAFYDCANLASVTIGNSVISIGSHAFWLCHGFTNITVDSENPMFSSDEYGVLFNKDKTKLIQYPIGNARTSYEISDSVTSIDDRAFYYCKNLKSVTISDSVTNIGDSVFAGCENLTSIIIPDSVTSIVDDAFNGCTSLASIAFSNNVISIGDSAFNGCDSLTDVYYTGTEEQWNEISIGNFNHSLTDATIHYSGKFVETDVTVDVRKLSTTTINYGDSIWLHAEIEGDLPAGAKIIWTPSNNNFEIVEVSADGLSCKITPKSSSTTTFTVSVVDAEDNVLSTDTQDMTAKAGLWQKIVAFFKKLFGITKTYPQLYKSLF